MIINPYAKPYVGDVGLRKVITIHHLSESTSMMVGDFVDPTVFMGNSPPTIPEQGPSPRNELL